MQYSAVEFTQTLTTQLFRRPVKNEILSDWCVFVHVWTENATEQWDAGHYIGSIQMDCQGVPGDLDAHKKTELQWSNSSLENIGHFSAGNQNSIHLTFSQFEPMD